MHVKPPLLSHLHLGRLEVEKSIRGFRRSQKARLAQNNDEKVVFLLSALQKGRLQ